MKSKGLLATVLAMITSFCIGIVTFAADNATASVPVTLTVDDAYFAINATVPSVLPVEVYNGAVFTAENVKIINHAKHGAVQVADISVTDAELQVDDYHNLSGNCGIALMINGCVTKGEGSLNINPMAFSEISAGQSLDIGYDAKVSGVTTPGSIDAANIVFTLSRVK